MLTDNGASIHPARYLAGLARLSLAGGAAVHAHTQVTAIESLRTGSMVRTSRGDIAAGEVLVATNGYTDAAAPWARRRIIPIGSYIIATEPLGDARAADVSPQRRMMSDTRNFLHYWRLSPDGRLVFGGRTSFVPVSVQTARDRLYAAMIDIYPQLAGVRVSHAWTGNVGFTFDQLPHLTRRRRASPTRWATAAVASRWAAGWERSPPSGLPEVPSRRFPTSAFRGCRSTGGTPGSSLSSACTTRCSIGSEESGLATGCRGGAPTGRTATPWLLRRRARTRAAR